MVTKKQEKEEDVSYVDLPSEAYTKRKLAAVLINSALEGNALSIREVLKFINVTPYVNTELEAMTGLSPIKQHKELMKLFAKNKITADVAMTYDKLIMHRAELEIVQDLEHRMKDMEQRMGIEKKR